MEKFCLPLETEPYVVNRAVSAAHTQLPGIGTAFTLFSISSTTLEQVPREFLE